MSPPLPSVCYLRARGSTFRCGLQKAREVIMRDARPDAIPMVLVMTDGGRLPARADDGATRLVARRLDSYA